MAYFLAVDAGGTKADFVLADGERHLARVRTGTIKRMRVDAETALGRLEDGLHEVSALAGITLSQVTRTCVGTAGESVPMVSEWLRAEFGARVGGELLVVGDVEIALDAAFPGECGVLALAGTGSNVVGRGRDGALSGAGGWGPRLADQGSGHRIGQQALRATLRALDEGQPSGLMDAVLGFWSLQSAAELVSFVHGVEAPDFSQLMPLVLRCAKTGDIVAREVLQAEGEDLGHLVSVVMRRLYARDASFVPVLAFAGSVLEHVAPVREALVARVAREFAGVEVNPGIVDPVDGALWRARTGL